MRQGFFNACVYAKQKINLAWPKDWLGYSRKTDRPDELLQFV